MHYPKPHLHKQAVLTAIFLCSIFYVGCAAPSSTPPSPPASLVSAVPFEKSIDVDLSSSTTISPQAKFTLTNQGNDPIVMPSVFLNGNRALNRSSILYPLQLQGLKDHELAKATWEFVIAHTHHYCYAGTPADTNIYASEPMSLLNGFGAMCCDQHAILLAWLWQGAGYPSRLVWMPFHEVSEIYYQGAWHMYDADHHVYYLQLDNKTVASTADLIANPFLVLRLADANGIDPGGDPAQQWADQYAVQTITYVDVDYKDQQIFLLQPGQSLNINNAKIMSPFPGPAFELELPLVGTGCFDWSLDYSNPNWSNLSRSTSGLTTLGDGASVSLTNSETSGFVVYELSSPFPVISLQVNGLVNLAGSNAAINAYFSTDGDSWSDAFPLSANNGISGQASTDLSSVASGQYSYFVKLALTGDASGAAQISNVHIVSDVQNSFFLFPDLIPGQINHLTYQDWSPATADHNVKVSFDQNK